MKCPPILFFIFLNLMFLSCTSEKSRDVITVEKLPSVGAAYIAKVKKTDGVREKIQVLNRALKEVDQTDTILNLLLDYKVFYHNSLSEYDSSLVFADKLLEVASVQQDTFYLARAYYRKSMINDYLDDYEALLENAFESKRHSLSIGDYKNAGQRDLEIANTQAITGDVIGSQESATEALRLLINSGDSSYIASSYNVLGRAYQNRGFYDDAISEYRNSLKYATSRLDSLPDLNNIAIVEKDKGNFDIAIAIWEELLLEVDTLKKSSYALYKDNLAYTKWLKEPQSNIERELLEALEIRLEANAIEGILTSYRRLAEYYENRDKNKAREYSEKYLDLAREYKNTGATLIALKNLISLAPPVEARKYSESYIRINDSLNAANMQVKNAFAKIRFDEERKQQEINNLEARSLMQQLETQRLRDRGLLVMLGVVILILTLIFLVYYLRQRHKKEKVQEVYRTESRISKVIHDELANDIFNIMSSLEQVVPEPVVDQLEKIYLRTRDISRENSDIDTGPNYLSGLVAALSNTTPGDSKLILKGETSVNWEKVGAEQKMVLYRVLQELLVNMKKHSKAKLVAVGFTLKGKILEISYSDTGKGFSAEGLNKGNGLRNVENRLASVNGNILFETAPNSGFKAIIRIPL